MSDNIIAIVEYNKLWYVGACHEKDFASVTKQGKQFDTYDEALVHAKYLNAETNYEICKIRIV